MKLYDPIGYSTTMLMTLLGDRWDGVGQNGMGRNRMTGQNGIGWGGWNGENQGNNSSPNNTTNGSTGFSEASKLY